MSKSKRPWSSFVRYMIYNYPDLCQEEKSIHLSPLTPSHNRTSESVGLIDKTATSTMQGLTEAKARQLEAVRQAIAEVRASKNGEAKIEVINLYYWKKSHKLYGAAIKVGFSVHTVIDWNTKFIDLVAEKYGLI